MGAPDEPYDPSTTGAYQPPAPYPSQPYQQQYQQQYQPAPYPTQYPGYPPAQYPGYPPQAYGQYPGYPPPPGAWGPRRPGTATAASVLAYVAGGLLIIAGILLFFGASVVHDFDTAGTHTVVTAELVLDGLVDLVAAGLLIGGAVSFVGGRSNGRVMLTVGAAIVIGAAVYWMVRFDVDVIFWALVYAALVIVALALAWTGGVTAWLKAVRP